MLCFDQAFSEGTTSTFDYSLKEKAPFTIRNSLGIPLIVDHSANLRLVGSPGQGKLHELPVDQNMELEHSKFEPASRGKLSALQRQESCLFNLTIGQTFSPALCWCCALSYAKLATGDVISLPLQCPQDTARSPTSLWTNRVDASTTSAAQIYRRLYLCCCRSTPSKATRSSRFARRCRSEPQML